MKQIEGNAFKAEDGEDAKRNSYDQMTLTERVCL